MLLSIQMRWKPFDLPSSGSSVDFVDGLRTVAGSGDPKGRSGLAIHVYTCNTSMVDKCEHQNILISFTFLVFYTLYKACTVPTATS